jgi:hypothetical protein
VGTGKTVLLSGYSLGGADAGNYTLQTPSNLTANITPYAISFTATICTCGACGTAFW